MKSASSNPASTAAGVRSMDRQTSETVTAASLAKSNASHHHKTGASASAHAPETPAQTAGSLYQRPIRPTQVEPSSGPGLQSSSPSAGKQSRPRLQQPQQQQQHPSIRPLMQQQHMSQARRSSVII